MLNNWCRLTQFLLLSLPPQDYAVVVLSSSSMPKIRLQLTLFFMSTLILHFLGSISQCFGCFQCQYGCLGESVWSPPSLLGFGVYLGKQLYQFGTLFVMNKKRVMFLLLLVVHLYQPFVYSKVSIVMSFTVPRAPLTLPPVGCFQHSSMLHHDSFGFVLVSSFDLLGNGWSNSITFHAVSFPTLI